MAEPEKLREVKPCIDSLATPCGRICIVDAAGNKVPFSLLENPYRPACHYADADGVERELQTDTNYLIAVDPALLRRGETYRITLPGKILAWGDSDERTVCVSGMANGYSIALGAYDPNEEEKMRQAEQYSQEIGAWERHVIIEPPTWEERNFVRYDVAMLEDESGFRFHRIDDDSREITFPVAWIKNIPGAEIDCQAAVELWTT